ncbi:family 3 adenylate cyclase [Candidatus Nitrososphaera evergladensis SR1]|jgi:adenylate cyclase|uniref:Family 3 adenylate cyclase n=1 Tax=Candidatus Nitrososphaera evergladensis SR1 TaxID=1459636 RepID=A0A075MYF4_9ARCH|nr:adenylate/guanylate cyclase domain-containing protein [Candidatus Nitrososphaera evergladensis]AIF84299.1 family 3 adenylate cyclase [Candidatus Nitrososphaera evergladensis SR1]
MEGYGSRRINKNENAIICSTKVHESRLRATTKQAAMNLYHAGLFPDTIAMQLDISREEVDSIIKDAIAEDEKKRKSIKQASDTSSIGMFYLDAVVNIENIIKSAQLAMWKSLKGEMEFNISNEDTQSVLEKMAESKATFVILYIDIVGSTKLSMTLPVDRLAAIIRGFTHEMSLVVSAYGGHVLKYLGDAILAFFVVPDKSNPYMPCTNAMHCARSMVRAVKEGFNVILNQEGYPELEVRIGIDVGENVVVQYGWDVQSLVIDDRQINTKKAHQDILGYTISMASKITGLAQPNQIVIGQYVYDVLDERQKGLFELLPLPPEVWSYVGSKTGNLYSLYASALQ